MATRSKFFADLKEKVKVAASKGHHKETAATVPPADNARQRTRTSGTSNINIQPRALKQKAPSNVSIVTRANNGKPQRKAGWKPSNVTPTKVATEIPLTTASPAPPIEETDRDLFNEILKSININQDGKEGNGTNHTGIPSIKNKGNNLAVYPTNGVDADPELANTTSLLAGTETKTGDDKDNSVAKTKAFGAPTKAEEINAVPAQSGKTVTQNDRSESNCARDSDDLPTVEEKDVSPARIDVLLIVSETNDKNKILSESTTSNQLPTDQSTAFPINGSKKLKPNESNSSHNATNSNAISSAKKRGREQLFEDESCGKACKRHSGSKENQEISHENSTIISTSNDSGVSLNQSPSIAPIFGGPDQVKRVLFPKNDSLISNQSQVIEIEPEEYNIFNNFFDDLPEGITDLEAEVHDEVPVETLEAEKLASSDRASGNSFDPVPEDYDADISATVSLTDSSFDPSSTSTAKKKQTRSYNPPEKRTRKRVSNPKRWKKNRNKEKLDQGEQYVTFKGKVVRAKALQDPCDDCCRLKCTTKVSEEDRKKVFETYWKKVPTKQAKWFFVHSLIENFEKKSATTDNSRRAKSRKYFLPVSGGRVQVCKVMFLATLDISDGQVTTATMKGKGSPDKRGKTARSISNKVNPALKESVREHIQSLPRMPSHYVRQESEKEYLTGDVASLAQLHEMYLQWMKFNSPDVQEVATYRQYSDIFNTEFNISFFIPKKDQCDFCIEYENSSELDQESLREKYDEHITNKTLVQDMRLADCEVAKKTKEKSLAVFCFDYEQTLICPRARASSFHFKRKLSVSNFTVARVGKVNEDVCYVYDETIASKGSNEVASFLWHFMKSKVEEGVTEFRMYSDNCWGQNKNRAVMSFLATFVQRFKDKDVSIVLRFLETGHSYNSADTVHSMIERKTKNRDIYAPEEWYNFIETAKRSKTHPIKVIRVQQDMVFDWRELADKLNFEKDTEGQRVLISKIREMRVETALPLQIQFRCDLADSTSRTLSLRKVGKPVNLATYQLQKAYSGPLPISKLKQTDLKYYCDNNLIPLKYHEFFRSLPASAAAPQDKDDDTVTLPGPGRERKRRARKAPKGTKKKSRVAALEENEEDVDDLTF